MLGNKMDWAPSPERNRPPTAPTYVPGPSGLSDAPSNVPFYLAGPLDRHLLHAGILADRTLATEANRARSHWRYELMLDAKERRLNEERKQESIVRDAAREHNFVFEFEERAHRREKSIQQSITGARRALDMARAAGRADYEVFVKDHEDHFHDALKEAESRAEQFGVGYQMSQDINGDGVIDEDEMFDDPHQMAKAFLKNRGLKKIKKEPSTAPSLEYKAPRAGGRFAPRSLLDPATSEDYKIKHAEDVFKEVLQMGCPDDPGSWDLHKWLANGETPEISARVPKHTVARFIDRVRRCLNDLEGMSCTRPHATAHCEALSGFGHLLEEALHVEMFHSFGVSSYFDNRGDKVFKEPSFCEPAVANSPVFLRM